LDKDYQAWGHNGGEDGASTDLYIIPEENVAVVVLANGEGSNMKIVEKLFQFALDFEFNHSVTVSGNISHDNQPLAEVTVTLSGDSAAQTSTNINGEYSFNVNQRGSYTITPVKAGFFFQQQSETLDNITENKNVNFDAYLKTFILSGTVFYGESEYIPFPEVLMTLEGDEIQTTETNDSGYYEFEVKSIYSYNLIPSKTGYLFDPDLVSINSSDADLNYNFFARFINPINEASNNPKDEFAFEILKVYPNPFSQQTTIQFSVPKQGHVQLTVYDILGRKIDTIIDENLIKSKYSIQWDAKKSLNSTVTNGFYFIRLQRNGLFKTERVLFLK